MNILYHDIRMFIWLTIGMYVLSFVVAEIKQLIAYYFANRASADVACIRVQKERVSYQPSNMN